MALSHAHDRTPPGVHAIRMAGSLGCGDIVWDNLGSQKRKAVRELIRLAGAKLFLSKCSPGVNSIERSLLSSIICSTKPPREPSMRRHRDRKRPSPFRMLIFQNSGYQACAICFLG